MTKSDSAGCTWGSVAQNPHPPHPVTDDIAREEHERWGETPATISPMQDLSVIPFAPLQEKPKGFKNLEAMVLGLGRSLCMVNSCQWSAKREPYIHIPLSPKQVNLEFLTGTGVQ